MPMCSAFLTQFTIVTKLPLHIGYCGRMVRDTR